MRLKCYPNLRAELARRGMTQADIGKILGLGASAVSERFCGKRDFKFGEMVKLAKFFDVSLEYFANDNPNTPRTKQAIRNAAKIHQAKDLRRQLDTADNRRFDLAR